MPDPVIRSIPLDRLELSPANVRRTAAGKTAFAELKASIAAHGLLENLVVRPHDPGQDGAVRYAVIAGGRRLSALADLAGEGAAVRRRSRALPRDRQRRGRCRAVACRERGPGRNASRPTRFRPSAHWPMTAPPSPISPPASGSPSAPSSSASASGTQPLSCWTPTVPTRSTSRPSSPSPSPPTASARWRCGSGSRTRATGRAAGRSSACSPRTASPPLPRSPSSSVSTPTRSQAASSTATSSPTRTSGASGSPIPIS